MYWYEGHPELYWAPCYLLHEEGDKLIVQAIGEDDEEPLEIKKSDARIVHPTVL